MFTLKLTTNLNGHTFEVTADQIDAKSIAGTKSTMVKYSIEAMKDLMLGLGEAFTPPMQNFDVIEEESSGDTEVYSERKVVNNSTPAMRETAPKSNINYDGAPATQKQINLIRHLGYSGKLEGFTVNMANQLIKQLRGEQP